MKYKHIVFDIDGTLIDTEYAVINSLIKTITEITGRAPQYESLKFALGITGRNALELLKILDIEDALKRWDRNMKLLQHTIQPFQGIKECLQSLLSRGYILGIVTSKTYQEYYSDFEPLGLADYFSTIVCADDTDEHKPQAAPLVAYLAKAHVSPETLSILVIVFMIFNVLTMPVLIPDWFYGAIMYLILYVQTIILRHPMI